MPMIRLFNLNSVPEERCDIILHSELDSVKIGWLVTKYHSKFLVFYTSHKQIIYSYLFMNRNILKEKISLISYVEFKSEMRTPLWSGRSDGFILFVVTLITG